MPSNRRAAVFVDRDNTLIHDPGYLRHAEHVRVLAGVGQAIEKLRGAGLPVVVVTNQSGVARGYLTEAELSAVHERMQELLQENGSGVDAIYYCPYLTGPDAVVEKYRKDSDLRKPKPGMLIQAAADLKLDLRASWMVGDSERDVIAGRAVGCKTILIGSGNNKLDPPPDFTAASFSKAAEIVLREMKARAQIAAKRREEPARENVTAAAAKTSKPIPIKEDKPSGGAVSVASAPVRVADPQVRILAPSVAEAHRNLIDPEAEASRAAKGVPDQPRALRVETASPHKVIPPEPELAEMGTRPEKSGAAIGEKPHSSEKRSEVKKEQTDAASNAASVRARAAPIPDRPNENVPGLAAPVAHSRPTSATKPHTPEHLLENIPSAAPEASLSQVLEEIRSLKREQRFSDFSFAQLAAAIAQAFSVCALAFGLYASVNGDTDAATFRVLLAVVFQLMALTGFIARRRS